MVMPNRAVRRQNQVQLPVNRRLRPRRAEIIRQTVAISQPPLMPPQPSLMPPQPSLMPPQQPLIPQQQPSIPPQQPLLPPNQLLPPQQPLMPPNQLLPQKPIVPQQPILPPQQVGSPNFPNQPAERQVPDQGCVHPGQSTARNTVQNNEILVIPTSNDVDVFVPQKNINQIWNLEYVDLAQLLYKNFV